jgi:replicative DNA helicase
VTLHIVKAPDLEWTYVASIIARPASYEAAKVDPYDLPIGPRDVLLAALAVRDRGERVNPMNLRLQLERDGYEGVEAMLGKTKVLIETELTPIAKRLRDLAEIARTGEIVQRLNKALSMRDIDAVRDLSMRLAATHDPAAVDSPVMTFNELIAATVDAISAEESSKAKMISLGMAALDTTYRLSPGSMMVVGAQTNVGKTSVLMTWLLSIAKRGIPVGAISVEDPEEDFGAKALGEMTGINPKRMWSGDLSSDDWKKIMAVRGYEMPHPFSFAYVGSRRLEDVLARIEFMHRVRGVRVVAVDYLQSILPLGHFNSRREAIDSVLAELISLCGRLGVALILASQLARPDKGSAFREPNLIDLKESGEIENRAQCVVLLWRDSDAPGADVHGKIAKAKRQPAGARFDLVRDPDTGMLIEKPEYWGGR